ncbi:MAG: hypothetical protein GY861_15960 [bacterium]|nr:hypothetical protein [bacterium]
MAFDRENLSIIVNNVKSGEVPTSWLYYDSAGDTVTAAGYMTDYRLNVGDMVEVLAAAYTSTALYRVSAVTDGAATLVASANSTYNPGGLQALSGAGAVDVVNEVTLWTTTGANAGTLADGTAGQRKVVKCVSDGGEGTLTPSNLLDGATLTFTEVNDVCELIFDGTNWNVVSNSGVVVA